MNAQPAAPRDPLGPRPCNDCGQELPYKVAEAGDFLYGGGSISIDQIREKIEDGLREEERKKQRALREWECLWDDKSVARMAVDTAFHYIDAEHLAAAARHYGYTGAADDMSECERVQYQKQCHEPTPDHLGLIEDPRPLECVLATHGVDTPHQFSYASVEVAR